jgi:hypothetical protein
MPDSHATHDARFQQGVSVTRTNVLNHVRAHGFPEGAIAKQASPTVGKYLLEEHGGFTVFTQERGVRFGETHHRRQSDAIAPMVMRLLQQSGAWTQLRR